MVGSRIRGVNLLNTPRVSGADAQNYGEWIATLGDWMVWGTMTFRPPEVKDGSTYTRRGRAFAWARWRQYRRRVDEFMRYWVRPVGVLGTHCSTLAVMELHESGVPHIHWLGELRGTLAHEMTLEEVARTLRFMSHETAGHSKVDVLEGKEAIGYVAKYVGKDSDAQVRIQGFDGKEITL